MTEPSTIPDRDRLPRWLFQRYHTHPYQEWADLSPGERIHWQEEADTVIKAVIKLSLYKIVGTK